MQWTAEYRDTPNGIMMTPAGCGTTNAAILGDAGSVMCAHLVLATTQKWIAPLVGQGRSGETSTVQPINARSTTGSEAIV